MELGTCYKPNYLQASFNGVAFQALEVSSEHGRRGAEGEFPFGNRTGYVDMGRKIRRYSLQARLDENSHLTRATALIAACEMPGPGILVHPTRGVLNAACVSLSVRDNVLEEQGITYVDMEFVEGELWQNGFGLTGALLGVLLRPVLSASSDLFVNTYSVASTPVWQQAGLRDLARGAAAAYAQEYDRSGNMDPQISADLWQLAGDAIMVDSAKTMDQLVRQGAAAIAKDSSAGQRFESFRRLANWAAGQVAVSLSEESLLGHVRTTAGAYMAQAATEREYANVDQALSAMDQAAAVLDQESDLKYDSCDNNLFLVLRNFNSDFIRRMNVIAYGRPANIQYDFSGAVSPLQAAYAIWDDATRARELLAANREGAQGRIGPVVVATSSELNNGV